MGSAAPDPTYPGTQIQCRKRKIPVFKNGRDPQTAGVHSRFARVLHQNKGRFGRGVAPRERERPLQGFRNGTLNDTANRTGRWLGACVLTLSEKIPLRFFYPFPQSIFPSLPFPQKVIIHREREKARTLKLQFWPITFLKFKFHPNICLIVLKFHI